LALFVTASSVRKQIKPKSILKFSQAVAKTLVFNFFRTFANKLKYEKWLCKKIKLSANPLKE